MHRKSPGVEKSNGEIISNAKDFQYAKLSANVSDKIAKNKEFKREFKILYRGV